MPSLNTKIMSDLLIYYPSIGEQRAIAHILGTLDDKIELNRRMNETLEAMARAMFKSWFVDFDPVRAKAEGRDPSLPKYLAHLFPGRFGDSQLGEIPKGWRVGTIGEDFNLIMGQSPPGKTYNEIGEGMPFFQGRADFGFRYPIRRVYCTIPTRIANTGDTLVSVRAPVGDINMALETSCIGRGVAAIRHKSGSRSYTYYLMVSMIEVFGDFEAEGTIFGCINKGDFQRIKFIAPPPQLVLEFEKMAFPADQTIENQILQSRMLAAIRDALLPKLLSGDICVKDAEKDLEVML
jgi:type I restriction enzyme S subunit